MKTLIVYLFGCLIGLTVFLILPSSHLILITMKWSIIISFLYTFIGRLIPKIRLSLIRMVPDNIPYPKVIVYLTGILELLISISLLFGLYEVLMSYIGIFLCIILFPANIKAYRQNIKLGDTSPTNIYLRFIIQLLFILSFVCIILLQ
ncbi:hypothetical protein [Abyssicoccus albus]|uniref:hypothetical protein n=1 Tax=Abyssicoccus albus TaxID=1817405 RepID=UPI00097E1AF2|nr:hypothetical protein [Abyssicoccus albus]AQL55583.1 hypothetical protein BVH56_00770 [Abyssicoccus albus]